MSVLVIVPLVRFFLFLSLVIPCSCIRLHLTSSFPHTEGLVKATRTICREAFCGSRFETVSVHTSLRTDNLFHTLVYVKGSDGVLLNGEANNVFFETACRNACKQIVWKELSGE